MTIKEVEQELNIPRATVRFYEKNKLLNPERGNNSYRDYSNEDIATLRKILIFRKIGMTISDIQELLGGVSPLSKTLDQNIDQLEKQLEELNGALKICRQMQSNHEELENFDEMYYWNVIQLEEKSGNKFLNIAKDAAKYEKKIALDIFGLAAYNGDFLYGKRETVLKAIGLCLFLGVVNFFFNQKQASSFWEGFFMPLSWFIVYTIFGLPLHFLAKKHPKLAKTIKTIGIGFFLLLLFLLFLFVIVSKIA
jgi:DNA-binding transcriptional MerR regulator